ncbi:hypothetical protein J437_LFUL007393 [Ladona fulva]|uniref:Reverse transcriptase domain-containing protein n=1 Tax=Ladona fulva TaxID=123851 RepID=A0A8K0K0P0_LADFU|nr:hypothetical protein J437_LFUL007393 [Ladona fulva]
MQEYIDLGHMKAIQGKTKEMECCHYLLHHGVWKESSSTTKLRVVFNGSQRTSRGVSLNSKLHTGANLLPDLGDVVSRLRGYRFVFTADIEKMFRQILVDERDQNLQNILWRFNVNDPLLSYRLQTLTYGLVCSPFLAIRCIRQLALEEGHAFPLAVPVLLEEIYMDDRSTGYLLHWTQLLQKS